MPGNVGPFVLRMCMTEVEKICYIWGLLKHSF